MPVAITLAGRYPHAGCPRILPKGPSNPRTMRLLNTRSTKLIPVNCVSCFCQSGWVASPNVYMRFHVKLLASPARNDKLFAANVGRPASLSRVSRLKSKRVPTEPTAKNRPTRSISLLVDVPEKAAILSPSFFTTDQNSHFLSSECSACVVEIMPPVYSFLQKNESEASHYFHFRPMNPFIPTHDRCHGCCKKDVTPHTNLIIPFVIRFEHASRQ